MAATTWHKDNKSWKKINEFLFKNETMADCAFLVTIENTIVKIPAHKYVLGGYSPEFYNLFYLLKSDSDEIPINDVYCGESFLKFLEFVYTETTELTLDNIEVLMMLAVRYSVESFKDFCVDFLMQNITGENVLTLMETFSIYDVPNFELKCFEIMSLNHLIFDDPSFYEISNETLTTIVKSKELKGFREITIFKGVDKWSEVFCDKTNREINSNNKRMALGEALQYIRFGAMTTDEFSSCTMNVENSVLTLAEMVKVYQFISTNGKVSCPYSGERRMNIMKREMFYQNGHRLNTETYTLNGNFIFTFTANKPIQFHGFGILGRVDSLDKQNPEKFIIKIKDTETKAVLLHDVVEIHHDGTQKVYELLFNNSKVLEPNKMYSVFIKRQETGRFLNYVYDGALRNMTTNDDRVNFVISPLFNFAASIIYEVED